MFRIPRWSRWLLGSASLVTVVGLAMLVPAIQQARNAAKKTNDR